MPIPLTLLRDLYRTMLLARRFDEAQIALYKTGKEPMEAVHSYIGQEAIGVGAGSAMADGDYLIPSLRSRPAFFARKVPLEVQWSGVLSKAESPGKGLEGSRHMAALDYGIVGTTGIVGAHLPVATGVGLALRTLKPGRAAVCLFGDGSTNRGDFHEGMNMASLYKVPLVFICEANGVAESQNWSSYMPIDDLTVRAAAYGMPGQRIDGNDVAAVYEATQAALARARSGGGPTFLVAETCRIHPHVEGLPDFREPALLEAWRARDPVRRAEEALTAAGALAPGEAQSLTAQLDAQIEAALEVARARPVLDATVLPSLVYFPAEEV